MDKKKNNNKSNQNPNQNQKANKAEAKRKEVVIEREVVTAKDVVIAKDVVTAKEVVIAKEVIYIPTKICFRDSQVADVKAKMALIKPTDPTKPRDKPPQKTEKKAAVDDRKPKKKAEDKKPKEAPVTTAVLKLSQPCLCEGCIGKINKLVLRTQGVQEMKLDKEKESVIVKGTMDAKALAESLKEKLKRLVEVVPPKKEKEGGSGKKKGGA